jgi:hypothetical protein
LNPILSVLGDTFSGKKGRIQTPPLECRDVCVHNTVVFTNDLI